MAVLNETAVGTLWPETAPSGAIGRTITTADGERRVVRIVADVRRYPGEGPVPSLFLPISAHENTMAGSALQLLVRMHPGQTFNSELLNTRLDERFGARRLRRPQSAGALQATWLERPRFVAAIFGTTAGIALLLAAIGVFALASFDAARRRHEMATGRPT